MSADILQVNIDFFLDGVREEKRDNLIEKYICKRLTRREICSHSDTMGIGAVSDAKSEKAVRSMMA